MAEEKSSSQNKTKEQAKEEKQATIKGYEKLIERLKKERQELKDEVDRDYREVRRYVRSHPEEGVLYSLLGGIAIGFILGKISGR